MLHLTSDADKQFIAWAQNLDIDDYIALLEAIVSGDSSVLFRLFYRHADKLKKITVAKSLDKQKSIAA